MPVWSFARAKGYPLKDVAKAGGWSSTAALEACYLQTDAATMLAVVDADSIQSTGHSVPADSQEAAEVSHEGP